MYLSNRKKEVVQRQDKLNDCFSLGWIGKKNGFLLKVLPCQ